MIERTLRSRSPRRLVAFASGIIAATAIIVPAALQDEGRTARLAVLYQCEAGTTATITVRLMQDDSRQGEKSVAATCIGKPLSENLEIDSGGAPWLYGESSAFMDITGNDRDREQAHKIKMRPPLYP
jgi:hypothetical protein